VETATETGNAVLTNPVRVAPVPPKVVPPVVSDTVSQAEIMSVVLAHKPEVLECVRAQKAADPHLHGTVVMGWSMARDGSAQDVAPHTSELADAPMTSCLVRTIQGWTFPAHSAAQPQVRFPFKF
jgi:hypothetical protein